VGGLQDIHVDVRVIAATNRDLELTVKEGKFREDLFYRLQVMPIVLPALRDRRGDIPLLANYYVDMFNHEFKKRVRGFLPAALEILEGHRWPGNIRELRNAIERALLLTDREWLAAEDFLSVSRAASGAAAIFQLPPDGVKLEDVERQLLEQALQRVGGNQTHAAQLLGINRDQVRYRIEKFGLGR
jgi:two-component system response regulator AtoC